jgi:DNA mismatch repair ATPase MutS
MAIQTGIHKTCGYLMDANPFKRYSSRRLKIGDIEISVVNVNNKFIRISSLNFNLLPSGKINMSESNYIELHSLEELKDTVKRYRLAYQEMKALEKKLKMQGDFV